MGKGRGRTVRANFGVNIHRGRLRLVAVLFGTALLLTAYLAPWKVRPHQKISASPSLSTPTDSGTHSTTDSVNASFAIPFVSVSRQPSAEPSSLYAYSVIPGGAHNPAELRNAILNDATVRTHYADFAIANTYVETIQKTQPFYVSYRLGNNIFWTKNAVTLHAGETVLSDGLHLARTRCGNRLSVAPVAPISKTEPAPEALEAANPAVLVAAVETLMAALPLAPAPVTAIAAPPPVSAARPPLDIFLPPPFYPMGPGTTPSTPGSSPSSPSGPTPPSGPSSPGPPILPPSSPTPPAVPAAEPSALLMLVAGLGSILILHKSRWTGSRAQAEKQN